MPQNELRAQIGVDGDHVTSQSQAGIVVMQGPLGLDFAHPIVPAMKMVGPLLASPGKPLPAVRDVAAMATG